MRDNSALSDNSLNDQHHSVGENHHINDYREHISGDDFGQQKHPGAMVTLVLDLRRPFVAVNLQWTDEQSYDVSKALVSA